VFSHLQVHSTYSLLRGVRGVEELVAAAKARGYDRLALTDIDSLYGVHDFIEAASEAGLRPIVGAELHGVGGRGTEGRNAGKRLVALVRNREGFANLCEILSLDAAAKREKREYGPASFFSAGEARLSSGLVLASDDPAILESLSGRVERLYAAVTPRSLRGLSAARRLGLPLLALGDVSFLDPEDRHIHRVLRAIAENSTLGRLVEADCEPSDALLFGPAEAERRFAPYPEALRATEEVAKLCTFDRIFDGFVFPAYEAPAGETGKELLRSRVYEGARLRYGEIRTEVVERIEFELDIISRKGFTDYFLVVADIVTMASRTCGRGSGAASIVSYCLGITNVDPIRHNLYFQRFLNLARPDPPDIDVDFAWDERDAIIAAVIERFGPDRCARVANHNSFRPRSALRETAKAYGLPDGEITEIEHRYFRLEERDSVLADPLWAEIFGVARRLVGMPKELGMHCGGLVITPGPIRRCAPVEYSAEGYPLLGWEKDGTEAAGLVKIDLLGNRSLAVVRDALAQLGEEGVAIDPYTWAPIDDRATVDMLARGDSMGVFYIESPAMRQLQKKTGRGDYAHIVIHSSIIRPAANDFINEYVRRLKGGEYEPLHPLLEDIFGETYGILCYQEDVSKTAVALAGFDDADADRLRKVLSKKDAATRLKAYEGRFFDGCRKNGVAEEVIAKVWEMIRSFEGFSFCKPHSASYAMVSFQSAYLRAHHPAAFMAAVLSNGGGYYTAQAYVSEARRMGLRIAGPDVNISRRKYHARDGAVVVGFMAISGLASATIKALLTERELHGRFSCLEDFSLRLALPREGLIALVSAGAFDSLAAGTPRSEQARSLLERLGEGRRKGITQPELFAINETSALATRRGRNMPAVGLRANDRGSAKNEAEFLRAEYDCLGFLREKHPFALWQREIDKLDRRLARDLPKFRARRLSLLGWPVTQKEVLTVEGRPMSFVSFEDETAIYETVFFPEAFERYRPLLYETKPFLIRGKVEDDMGALYLNVEGMEAISTRMQ